MSRALLHTRAIIGDRSIYAERWLDCEVVGEPREYHTKRTSNAELGHAWKLVRVRVAGEDEARQVSLDRLDNETQRRLRAPTEPS